MSDGKEPWLMHHFSQSNGSGRGQGYVPALLRRVADSIEELGDVTVFDITFSAETTGGEQDLTMTVYYSPEPRPVGSSMEASADYEPLRHAPVEHPTVAWIVIGHWASEVREEWCVEAWNAEGDRERDDENFDTLEDADAYALATFGVDPDTWAVGPNPSRSSDWR